MKPVIQDEKTGCAIASAAAIAGITYREAKQIANSIGIFAEDTRIWSETSPIRDLLRTLGVEVGNVEVPFEGWESLPNTALLAIKWHMEKGRPFWHWVVFLRNENQMCVLDSKKSLKNNIRYDFGRMHPKWFIEVKM